ncbi:MAG: hypothetical protein KJ072_24340 [Verrucomicrobia bacterium]|nr:hypothetical protein [Verrucomicrobiota bacterium]
MNIQHTENAGSESQPNPGRLARYLRHISTAPGKYLAAALVLAGLVSMPLLTKAGASSNEHGFRAPRLEGSWINTVSPILPPGAPPRTFQTYMTFTPGGAAIGSDRTRPFASPQHGAWVHVRGNQYANIFVQDIFDPAGTFLGVFKVRALMNLTGNDELIGVANVEQTDPDGNLQLSVCARFHATRLVPEPFESPCEGLEPGM